MSATHFFGSEFFGGEFFFSGSAPTGRDTHDGGRKRRRIPYLPFEDIREEDVSAKRIARERLRGQIEEALAREDRPLVAKVLHEAKKRPVRDVELEIRLLEALERQEEETAVILLLGTSF